MVNVNYNNELDILVIEKDSYEDYTESVESNEFVLDLDSDSEFLGVEIIDASQKISLAKEELMTLES